MFLQLLEVQHESAGWIMDAIRSVFWLLAKGILILLDGMFNTINEIWHFKFFDNEYVNKICSAAIVVAGTWLILKVIIEIIMNYYINQDNNSSPLRIIKGIIFSITMMFLISPGFNWGYDLSSKITQYVITTSSTGENSTSTFEASMSSMILSAFSDDSKMDKKDKEYFIDNWFTADYNSVINDGLFDSGEYKYSFNTFSIFLTGLVVVILLFFIGIQVAKRIIELALYKAIGPFVCTSLVSSRSHAFDVWCKSVMGAFLVTSVQYLCIGILFNVFGTVVNGTSSAMAVILIVIGALLFIISSPQVVSALLNTNTGVLSNMGELHSMATVGLLAMSKFSKTKDSTTNTNQNNNTSSNDNNSSSNNSGSMSNSTSRFSTSDKDTSNNGNFSNSPNINNQEQSDNANNNYGSDLNIPNTSLSERLNAYNEMLNGNYSFDNSSTLYKTNIDSGSDNTINL